MKELQAEENEISMRAAGSLRREFHRELLSPFNRAVREYRLIKPGDRIAVCISGGKDSMLMAKLFEEYRRNVNRSGGDFSLEFISLDPGYSEDTRRTVEENAGKLALPLKIFPAQILSYVDNLPRNPCFMCAKMRRGNLYAHARELGCNKIALGQHYDDVIETVLMSMIYGGQVQTMMPRVHSANFPGLEIIRPLYFIREADIIRWSEVNGLKFIKCACRFTAGGGESSARRRTRELISRLKEENPQVETNIFRSIHNVRLTDIISYKDGDGKVHSFLDRFD